MKAPRQQYNSGHLCLFISLFVFLSISYFYFGTYRNWPYKIESDGKYYYQYLVSGLMDKDLDFTNNYRIDRYEWMRTDIDHYQYREQIVPQTGKPVNPFSIGTAVLWSPFFIISRVFGRILNALHYTVDISPFGKYLQYTTIYSGILYCLAAFYLLSCLLKLCIHDLLIKYVLWLILLASPLYYYIIFEGSMSHAYDFFAFTLVLFLFMKFSINQRVWFFIAMGLACALHVLVRTQNIATIVIGGFILLFPLRYEFRMNRDLVMKIGLSILFFSVGILPILLTNNYIYGSPFIVPQGNDWLNWGNPQILSVLFSSRNGLFSHHPVLLIGFTGYICLVINQLRNKKNVPWMVFLFLAFFVQVYINSTIALDWWGGHSYGQRRLVFSLPLFAFGLGYWFEKIRVNYPTVYDKYVFATTTVLSLSGFYLTMIHVFLWDYDQPHNIFKWMFYDAPIRIWREF